MSAQPLTILWRDAHLIVVQKPAGWLVHRTRLDAHEDRFVMQTLRDQIGQHVYPVHRLDKGTSGVLVLGLSSAVAASLGQAFARRQVGKRYVAMVRGWPSPQTVIDHALRPDDAPQDAPAQPARTVLHRLATWSLPVPVDRYATTRVALVEAWPQTGRRHQIRRHLKHLAHPIIGDATHGKGAHNRWWAERLGCNRLWLHAAALALVHPVTQRPMRWQSRPDDAALNPDWARLLREGDWQPIGASPSASLQLV